MNKYFNVEVVGVFCAYVAVLVVLALLSVGNVITIVTKKGGKRPRRRVNSMYNFCRHLLQHLFLYVGVIFTIPVRGGCSQIASNTHIDT